MASDDAKASADIPGRVDERGQEPKGSAAVIPAPLAQGNQYWDVLGNVSRIHDLDPSSRYQQAVARLEVFAVGEGQPCCIGTGSMLAGDLVLTAGHVIYGPRFGTRRAGYACKVRATVATAAGPKSGWGSQVIVYPGFAADPRQVQFDFGLVRLDAAIAEARAWTPAALPDSAFSPAARLDVSGFPGATTTLRGATGVVAGLRPGMIYHRVDTEGGQSGAPLCLQQAGPLLLHGVHRSGQADAPRELWPANGAVRVSDGMIGWLQSAAGTLPGGSRCA